MTSTVRTEDHVPDLKAVSSSIQPLILSLEDDPVSEFAKVFAGKDVVVFAAGSGGKGGLERLAKVDYEGAVKVFDAIEAVTTSKPHLVLVSTADSRDYNAPVPSHYVSIS